MSSATLAKVPPTPTMQGASAGSASNSFVINLVSSTTPVALTRPDHAGLKRFTFFVSRRREDGRERFRLHMGYFDTQEEAEQLLDIVRTIYPGAWAGLAPGRRLAAAAAAAAAGAAAAAEAPLEVATNASTSTNAPARADTEPVRSSPVVTAVPAVAPLTAATATAPASPVAPRATTAAAEMTVSRLALVPDEARRPLADVDDVMAVAACAVPPEATAVKAPVQRAQAPASAEQRAARHSLRNIRAAIASLEDSGIHSPVLDALPTLSPAVIPVAQPASAVEAVDPSTTLSNTATLRLLEAGAATREMPVAAASAPSASASASPAAAAVRPAGAANAASAPVSAANAPRVEKPCYAVQLVWSVQPIDMAQIPQLAIFSAYSLYGAEGNRDGRRWYGLRLGFFTDAVSAKQVAQYVRSDFATVSVVPVTAREREQALRSAGAAGAVSAADTARPASAAHTAADTVCAVRPAAAAAKPRSASRAAPKQPEFAFIEGTESPTSHGSGPAPVSTPSKPVAARTIGGRPTRGAPGKRAKVRKPGQVNARTPVKPKTLEETLEILGANQLQVDDGSEASINDSGVRHLRLEPAKARPSKLSRLIGRLSERMGG